MAGADPLRRRSLPVGSTVGKDEKWRGVSPGKNRINGNRVHGAHSTIGVEDEAPGKTYRGFVSAQVIHSGAVGSTSSRFMAISSPHFMHQPNSPLSRRWRADAIRCN